MMCRINSLVVFLLTHCICAGQVDVGYIQYLSSQKLDTEHRQYLAQCASFTSPDSLRYFQLKYQLQYRNSDAFMKLQPAQSPLFMNDSAALLLTGLWVLEDVYQSRMEPSQWLLASRFQSVQQLGHVMAMGMQNGKLEPTIQWPSEMVDSWTTLQAYSSKKPWKAALLSTIIPGSGKIYAQRSRVALMGMIGLSLFGAQSFEAYRKLGIKHPLTIGNIAVFGIFYGGNIYGSARAVKSRRTELRNKFYKDASFYYRRLHRPLLY